MTGDRRDAPAIAALADLAPALLWMSDLDGGGALFNSTWLAFTGMTHDQARDEGWVAAVHPDDRELRLGAQREATRRREPFEAEYRLRRHDGAWRWVLDRGVPRAGAASGVIPTTCFVGACLDITERRVEEQELLRSREDLRLALAAGSMGTWVWDRRTGSVTRNRNLQTLYGLDPDEATGTFDDWVELVHPEDRERVLSQVEQAMAQGGTGTYELEHRVLRPDGEVRWLARRGAVYLDDAGEVAGTRGLVVDVTERRRAEDERSRLLAAERESRQRAEQAAGRVARLQAVTSGLADARSALDVAEVIVVQGVEGLAAASGALCLLVEGGTQLEVIRHVGYDLTVMERYQTVSLDAPLPASDALRTGKMVLLQSLDERDERYPILRAQPARNASFAVVPLVVGDHRFGAIALGWPEPRIFDDHDKGFLTALGQQAAQALDRARFYEAEHARAQRQGFLAEASRLLGSSLDYEWALAEVARLAVPSVADACAVLLLEDGGLRTVALSSADVVETAAADPGETGSWSFGHSRLLDVAETGESLLVPSVGEPQRRTGSAAGLDDRAGMDDKPGVRGGTGGAGADNVARASHGDAAGLVVVEGGSAMAVSLRDRDEALGVVLMTMGSSGRRFERDDVQLVEDLAGRAAAAIANSRSHQARTAIAHTLQHSLLPPEVPILPGLEVAARYRPVGDDVEVGGDFYDVFAAGGGRWGVVIGDVSGKGVPAASLTALARYTVRTASRGEAGPSGVLEVLNNSILDDGAGERFCTVALAFLRHDETGVHFTLSCGGQPLPLLVDRHGDVNPVGQPGTAIGLFGDPKLTDVSTTLGPGDMLVLFTDGVVEARSPSGAFADGLLEHTLRSCVGLPAEAVADAIEDALLDFVGGRPRDDTAIIVLRRPPGVFHQHLAPGPRAVPRARRRLRDWLGDQLADAPELAGDVLMLANELTTNAERVARTAVDVHVSVDADQVTVDVSDDGPGFGGRLLRLAEPPADAVGGRGMHIVNRLADRSIVRSGSCGTLFRCIISRHRGSPLAPG